MGRAAKIRAAKIRRSTETPDIKNRNRSSKPQGVEQEKNAIADDIKSTLMAYDRQGILQRAYDEQIQAGVQGNYGEDDFLVRQEFESGYESVVGVENQDYDQPILKRKSEAVVVEQDEKTGNIKVVKDKNYHKD